MTEYYVVDKATKRIVNCITSGRLPSLTRIENPEYYYITTNPPMPMLHEYEFWNKRP